jgi:hypothetical protein
MDREMAVKVTQPEEPIAAEIIADSIVQIAEGMRRINSTRLTRKAIVILIQSQSKVPRLDIEIVLNNLADLEKDWLKPATRAASR